MGILRRLREWREDSTGTLIGPDIDADLVTTDDATIVNSLDYPISDTTDKSGSRSLGTFYQNTTGNPLYVCVVVDVGAGSDAVRLQFDRDNDSASDDFPDSIVDTDTCSPTSNEKARGSVTSVVPDGAYYRISEFGDTANATLITYNEGGFGK